MLLGVAVIFLPFLGFPSSWDNIISIVLGLLIIVVSYKLIPSVKSSKSVIQPVTNSVPQKESTVSTDLPFVDHKSDQESVSVNSIK